MANQLSLRKTKSSTLITGIGQSDLSSNETVENFMQSRVGDFYSTFTAIVVPTITEDQPSSNFGNIDWKIPSNIELADPLFFKSQRVDLLIGASLFFDLLCVGQIHLNKELPLLQKTRLGWIVSGGGQCVNRHLSCLAATKNLPLEFTSDQILHNLVKQFWDVEDCKTSELPRLSKDDLDCENQFVKNYFRLKSGQYSVRLPTKVDRAQLGDSYQLALRRFINLEKRLQARPDLKVQYSSFMKEYLDLQHMSPVNSFPNGVPIFFLPHHCVQKADSTTTKLRVVFDGSAQSLSGLSLNDVLLAGPVIQPKLFEILLRFRSFEIALTGDICKMYRCVRVSYPDNFMQCILWRDNPKDQIRIYKLDTVTYGTKPAAFLAIRTMHQLALDEQQAFPIGAKIIRRDFYVDDLISGGNSVQEVIELMQQTASLLEKGNFKLRKWCSNKIDVLSSIPNSEREQYLKFHDGSEVTKTLGLVWDPNGDSFLFSFTPMLGKEKITKRNVLSAVARCYDPLGLIGPIIVKAKVFLQLLWKENINWDESLPQYLQTIWLEFCAEFQLMHLFSFPRFLLAPIANIEIHAFCDASQLAYGACIYIRAEGNGVVKTNLLCSKSRVSPLKTITIPKLELSAATLLAELVHAAISKLQIFKGEIHCWSDSTVVLSWIKEEPSNFNAFVANRVSKIQTLTTDMTWHYVPTLMNPADILSKGVTPKELLESTLWKHGPEFLQGTPNEWPTCAALSKDLPEKRKTILLSAINTSDFSINCKFINDFNKMQRVYAYIYKFISFKNRDWSTRENPGFLSVKDIQQGTYLLIRMMQRSNLSSEYRTISAKKNLDSSSKIAALNPFLDSNGLLRVGGRLQNSTLDFDSRHPIILPKKHPLTDSIIDYYHRKFLHAGPQSLLASVRLQFWPIEGRKTVTRVINKCIRCFRLKPKVTEHIMGNLPAERVQASRTFLVTGIDFCGPFYHQSEIRSKSPIKCYICLFICFATKAVHLELVKDLSTPAFLAALKRFVCTRGKPHTIWTDNATNFVGAKNELAELRRLFLSDSHNQEVRQSCLNDGIEWQFIPPRSPHFGSLWEASVKLAKFYFWRVVGSSVLSFDELRTLVCQIAAMINSRPICSITENPDDLEVLTPAHFLVGAPFTSIVEPNVTTLNVSRLSQWQRVCYLQQIFWKKWSTAYLTDLQQRNKWRSQASNLTVGQIVLVKDENLPPLKWPLARIIETIKGDDDVVRVAVIRTSTGKARRSVTKLCVLPIDDDTVERLDLPTAGGC